MYYTTKDKKAVNLLSMVFLGIGGLLIVSSLLQAIIISSGGAAYASSLWANFFIKRSLIGGAFVLCSVILHIMLKRDNSAIYEGLALDLDAEPAEVLAEQP